jgi:hypothetical protein
MPGRRDGEGTRDDIGGERRTFDVESALRIRGDAARRLLRETQRDAVAPRA